MTSDEVVVPPEVLEEIRAAAEREFEELFIRVACEMPPAPRLPVGPTWQDILDFYARHLPEQRPACCRQTMVGCRSIGVCLFDGSPVPMTVKGIRSIRPE